MNDSSSVPDGADGALSELRRQKRLVDQGITMQANVRDRDRLVGTVLVLTILIASLIGVAFAFAGGHADVTLLGLTANRATWVGWLAVLTSALTLVELVLDRRGAAQRRSDAVRVLGALKAEYRTRPAKGRELAEAARMSERYSQAMETVPAIPERRFNRLKAAHLLKVEVSKLLSKNPGMSYRRAKKIVRKRYGSDDQVTT